MPKEAVMVFKMFDKYLCKYMGKSNITFGDVAVGITKFTFSVAAFVAFSWIIGFLMLLLTYTFIPCSDYITNQIEMTIFGFGNIVCGSCIFSLMRGLFKVEIATCPKKK